MSAFRSIYSEPSSSSDSSSAKKRNDETKKIADRLNGLSSDRYTIFMEDLDGTAWRNETYAEAHSSSGYSSLESMVDSSFTQSSVPSSSAAAAAFDYYETWGGNASKMGNEYFNNAYTYYLINLANHSENVVAATTTHHRQLADAICFHQACKKNLPQDKQHVIDNRHYFIYLGKKDKKRCAKIIQAGIRNGSIPGDIFDRIHYVDEASEINSEEYDSKGHMYKAVEEVFNNFSSRERQVVVIDDDPKILESVEGKEHYYRVNATRAGWPHVLAGTLNTVYGMPKETVHTVSQPDAKRSGCCSWLCGVGSRPVTDSSYGNSYSSSGGGTTTSDRYEYSSNSDSTHTASLSDSSTANSRSI